MQVLYHCTISKMCKSFNFFLNRATVNVHTTTRLYFGMFNEYTDLTNESLAIRIKKQFQVALTSLGDDYHNKHTPVILHFPKFMPFSHFCFAFEKLGLNKSPNSDFIFLSNVLLTQLINCFPSFSIRSRQDHEKIAVNLFDCTVSFLCKYVFFDIGVR